MDAQNPIDKNAEATPKIPQENYAIATFIMGCLVNEQVVRMDNSSGSWSDIQVGIQIIAACLQKYDRDCDRYLMPFQW